MIVKRARRRQTSRGFDLEDRHPARRWFAGCAGKPRYGTEAAAIAGIGLQLGRASLDVYRCGYCAGWHHTEARRTGQRKAQPPVHLLSFICARCGVRSADVAASAEPWSEARRRVALLKLEPIVIEAGWSVGVGDQDHCPTCATALGLETLRGGADVRSP